MTDRRTPITVMISSQISPPRPAPGFRPWSPFTVTVPEGTTLGKLTEGLFADKRDEIGLTAVNGNLASEETVLRSGDEISIYPILEGG